jgi:hypothetical protein
MNEIKIFDNFLNYIDHEKVLNYMSRPCWSFDGGGDFSRFWHMNGLENEPLFSEYLFSKICRKLNLKLKIVRTYANGQTACQSGVPHTDDGDITFLYYPTQNWEVWMGGSLNFLDSKFEIIRSIQYKENRGLCFPANTMHYAGAPERRFNGLRISIAWKLKIL